MHITDVYFFHALRSLRVCLRSPEKSPASSLSVEWFLRVIRPAILLFGLLLLITHTAPIGSAQKGVVHFFKVVFANERH